MDYNEEFEVGPELKKLVNENLPKLKQVLFNDALSFCFIPSVSLMGLVSKNEHPTVRKLPQTMKELILCGKPFAIQKRMVYELLTNTLDSDNSFILKNGDVRVLGNNESILNIEGSRNDN